MQSEKYSKPSTSINEGHAGSHLGCSGLRSSKILIKLTKSSAASQLPTPALAGSESKKDAEDLLECGENGQKTPTE